MSIIKKRWSPLAGERKRDKRKAVSGGTGREGCGSTHSDRLNSRAPDSFSFPSTFSLLWQAPSASSYRSPPPSIHFLFISLLLLPPTPLSYPFFSLLFPLPSTRLPPIIIFNSLWWNGLAPIYTSSCLKKKKREYYFSDRL